MEIKKVYKDDFEKVYALMQYFENTRFSKNDFQKLFTKHWACDIDYCGLMVEEDDKVVAYLGLIFSNRKIGETGAVFCNLTSLVIHPSQRGKKLTHKIVAHLKSLGNYTLTAITPIPSLYNMYRQNGFVDLNDYRQMLWCTGKGQQQNGYSETPEIIQQKLSGESARLYANHRQFNCIQAVFEVEGEVIYMVFKQRVNQLKKFLDLRVTNYADIFMRKAGFKGFLYRPTVTYELMYVDRPALFPKYAAKIISAFAHAHKTAGVAVPIWLKEKYGLSYKYSTNFIHSRQMYYSANMPPEAIDTLYSEIFVLDM